MPELTRGYTTAAEDAAAIRAAYKAHGWGRKEIGVRCSNFSMGSAVDVTIKSPVVDPVEAERIAKDTAEHVRRCEITGDILSGGNRYVDVRYSDECKAIIARRHRDALDAALYALPSHPTSSLERVGETDVYVGWEHVNDATLWRGSRLVARFYTGSESGLNEGAFLVARALMSAD